MVKKDNELLTKIDKKVVVLMKFGDKLDNYILDEEGFPIPDLDENEQPKLDKDGEIIYLKKEKEKKSSSAKPGFSVRYKSVEERSKMQELAKKYNDAVNERSSFNEYVRKVTTRDVYKEISDLELKLKIAENKVKDLEQALGMTTSELRKKKKGKS